MLKPLRGFSYIGIGFVTAALSLRDDAGSTVSIPTLQSRVTFIIQGFALDREHIEVSLRDMFKASMRGYLAQRSAAPRPNWASPGEAVLPVGSPVTPLPPGVRPDGQWYLSRHVNTQKVGVPSNNPGIRSE